MPGSVPEVLAAWMRPFRGYFTAAVWRHVLVLVAGALLAPGRRAVAAALRIMGLGQAPGFAVHHRVLSHGRWSSRAVAHRLLLLLAPVPWAGWVWGLRFLTVLAPSERHAAGRGRRHKTLTDRARQALLQTACWLPGRRLIAVADSSFAAIASPSRPT